jgi:hypothetical protein
MAHYAILNDKNYVTNVVKVDDEYEGNEHYLAETFGNNVRLVQTSINTRFGIHLQGTKPPLRMNYAGIGFFYDARKDAFIPPQPYQSWILNEDTCAWEPPTPYPNEPGSKYDWFELGKRWERADI